MKMKLIFLVALIALASETVVGCTSLTEKTPAAAPDAAIQIAKDALKTHFPDKIISDNYEFTVYEDYELVDSIDKEDFDFKKYEKDGVWIVLASPIALTENEKLFTFGGGYSVYIRKSDGKVLKVQVEE